MSKEPLSRYPAHICKAMKEIHTQREHLKKKKKSTNFVAFQKKKKKKKKKKNMKNTLLNNQLFNRCLLYLS